MPARNPSYVENPEALGLRLREARLQAGLAQSELAFQGCSAGYISRIEGGERVPSLQILRQLSKRLRVSEDLLLTGREEGADGSRTLLDAEIALRLGDYAEAKRLYSQVHEEADDDVLRSQGLEGLGQLAAQEGQPRLAIALLEEALASTEDDPADRPRLAEALARTYANLGEWAPAIALLERCLQRSSEEHDTVQYIRFACLLGYALTDSGDFLEAERVVAGALRKGQEVVDPYTRARLSWSQSRLLLEQGKSAQAETYARKTLETLRETEDRYALAHAHESLAHICLDLGRAEEASDLLEEGWPLIQSAASALEISHYRIEQARSLAALGRKEEAMQLALGTIDELGEGFPVNAGRAYVLVADILFELGDYERARMLYQTGLETMEPHGTSRYLVAGYKGLARVHKSEGNTEEAFEALERAMRLQEEVGRVLM